LRSDRYQKTVGIQYFRTVLFSPGFSFRNKLSRIGRRNIKSRRHAELVSASPKFLACQEHKAILKQVQDDGALSGYLVETLAIPLRFVQEPRFDIALGDVAGRRGSFAYIIFNSETGYNAKSGTPQQPDPAKITDCHEVVPLGKENDKRGNALNHA
jgi:hypothetical protein